VKTLRVGLSENGYDILIEDGLLGKIGGLVKPFRESDKPIAAVTDENVWRLHGERFSRSMDACGVSFRPVVMRGGEGDKSLSGLASLYDEFAGLSLTRNGLVAAFGGGVVGDLCGFAAATWMRGVRFIQIPTTLLAQVDSSVGGKTAINLPHGKNLAGAFHQPALVVIDPNILDTLPPRETRCGMAEVIKYGAISSPSLFKALSGDMGPQNPSEIIYECCRIKSEIVARDERDFGERALLNFGHTFGHAIEKKYGFERYRHGEAVAVGMTIAASAGEKMGLTSPGTASLLKNALNLHGIETGCPCEPEELIPLLEIDKKSLGGAVQFVLLKVIGEAFVRKTTFGDLRNAVREMNAA
jgi:3-dehydroquinate synthase